MPLSTICPSTSYWATKISHINMIISEYAWIILLLADEIHHQSSDSSEHPEDC